MQCGVIYNWLAVQPSMYYPIARFLSCGSLANYSYIMRVIRADGPCLVNKGHIKLRVKSTKNRSQHSL